MLLLFPRKGKHSRDAIDFLIIFTIEILPVKFPAVIYDAK